MRVLAFDPGTQRLGYGVLDVVPGLTTYVDCGVLVQPARLERWARIQAMSRELADLFGEFKPGAVAMEDANWVGQKSAALALGEIRGAILARAADAGLEVVGYGPTEAKAAVAGGRADKQTVAVAVQRILGLARMPSPDAADALAIALRHAAQIRSDWLLARAA